VIKQSLFLSLVFFISCSSIHFSSHNQIPTSFDYKEDKDLHFSVEVSKPFYMWGMYPNKQTVYVDDLFISEGYKSISHLQIAEVNTNEKVMWMLLTFGMYYPQTYMLSGTLN
jgi:hypothetical protein